MAEIDYEELDGLVLNIETQDGGEIEAELITVFEYEGTDYAVFTEKDGTGAEVFIFEVLSGDEKDGETEVTFNLIMDEEKEQEIFEIFKQVMEEESDGERSDVQGEFIDIHEESEDGSWVVRL